MAKGQLYKIAFAASWLANLMLFCLVSYVLVESLTTTNEELDHEMQLGIYISFVVFAILFICFTASFVIFLARKTYLTLVMAIVFIVGQFLCVLVTSLSLFSSDQKDPNVRYREDPVQWIIDRRWLPLLFAVVFLPLFALQIFMINRYANSMGLSSSRESEDRKSAPYSEKIYIAKDGH